MRIVTFILILTFISLQGISQTSYTYLPKMWSFGPKLGFNIGSPMPIGNVPKGAKGTPLACHNLGLFFNYAINKHLSVQMELLYSRKGAKFTTPIDSMPYTDHIQHPVYPEIVFDVETFFNGTAKGAFDNYYFEIPLMLNWHFANPKWSVCVGGYYSFLTETQTHAQATGTAGYDPTIKDEYIDFAENTRDYDSGVIVGGQYTFNNRISINMRISYGFESILVDSYSKIDYSLNNTFVQVAATYSFYPQKW